MSGPGGAARRPPVSGDLVLAALPDAVVLVTADGVISWVGPRVRESFGWRDEELVGRSIFDLFAKRANDDLHRDAFAATVAEPGVHGPIEVTVVRPDGRLREVEFTITNALHHPDIGHMVAIGRDITERDHAAEAQRQRDAWASSLLRGTAELIVVTDRNGEIAYASPSAERILAHPSAGLAGTALTDLVHPEDLLEEPGSGVPVDRVLGTAPGRGRLLRLRHADGSWVPLQTERTAVDDLGEHLLLFVGREADQVDDAASLLAEQTVLLERIARGGDVDDSLRAVAQLVAQRLEHVQVVIGHVDRDGYRSVSPTVGLDRLAVLERAAISRPSPLPDPEAGTGLRWSDAWDAVVHAATGGELRRAWVVDLLDDDGPIGRMVVLLPDLDEPTPAEADLIGLAVDLATIAVERHHLQVRLAHGALHDELTGLPNRRYLVARLEEAFAVEGARAGVLFVDIDRFKLINDSLGHEAGDQLLQEVAARFRRALRPVDLVARVGGDEFVVLCPDLEGPKAAAALAGRLTDALAAPVDLPGGRIVVAASIGVVHAVGPAVPAEVLQDADLAMYDAKERGRNRIALFHEGLRDKAIARLETESALRDALRADEMVLHYQPVVRLRDRSIVGVEALLRWNRPGYGMVSPGAFVPVATDTGLILPLGRWVIEQATRAAARWPTLEVAANLSARQLADADLVDFVADSLARNHVRPERLCLEVTEADLVTDPDTVVLQLRRFKELGVRLAIDDFGTGFATLDYLRRFSAADILKVDASFVAGIADPSSHDLAIVSAALVLADNLGFDTVAEGVETEDQRAVLERLGCELGQGHLFSVALSADQIDELLAASSEQVASREA